MQILQWLFKLAKEEGRSEASSTTHHDSTLITNPRTYLKDITRTRTTRSGSKQGQRKSFRRNFWQICRRDVEEACFYGTLSLRRLGLSCSESRRRRRLEELFRSIAKMKQQVEEQEQVASRRFDSNNIKVLPVTEATNLNLATNLEKIAKERTKSEQTKAKATISRMKELIRWAAAAKSDKTIKFISPKILEFRRRSTPRRRTELKDDEDETHDHVTRNTESPKISFRWENESTLSSIYTDISAVSSSPKLAVSVGSTPQYPFGYRRGNWITTDSEFVVLEL